MFIYTQVSTVIFSNGIVYLMIRIRPLIMKKQICLLLSAHPTN